MNIRNIYSLKSAKTFGPEQARQLGEALEDLQKHITNMNNALAIDSSGNQISPPPINKLRVTAADGIHQLSITDNNNVLRPINYFAEYSPKSDFSNSHVVPLGPSRNARLNLGNNTLHWRAYSQYTNGGPPSTPVIHGNGINPTPVTATYNNANLAVSGPSIPISSGSGTSINPAGGVGAGKQPYTSISSPPKLG